MRLESARMETDRIIVRTEAGTRMKLMIVGCDWHACYAVRWDAGDRWECGQFVDIEDAPELYVVADEGKEFLCEDGTLLHSMRKQDGGFAWTERCTGHAPLTAGAQQFLEQCDAVLEIREVDGQLEFFFDPSIEVRLVPESLEIEWE
jgi:hypothetical protein